MNNIGKKISVNGIELNIYTEGGGDEPDKTLIFMAGFGSCSPILDFKLLYTKLTDKFKIAVIEKPGYGFSDVSSSARDLKTMVDQQRKALTLSGISPPYVLCPLSLSGLEALYWASSYQSEVEAIVGLDMSFSETMKEFKYSVPLIKLMGLFMRSKIARLFPKLAESEAFQYGNLTAEEKSLYKELFFEKTMSKDMINEAVFLKENIHTVEMLPLPEIPMLLFVSNGEETGIEKNLYLKTYDGIIKKLPNAKVVNLDCNHFVHIFKSENISDIIKEYL